MLVSAVKRLVPKPLKVRIKNFIWERNNKRLLDEALAKGDIKLHLACGDKVLAGWINTDNRYLPGTIQMNMPHGMRMFPNASASFAYCSHMLHYLDNPGEVQDFVREVHRILKPGGVFRVCVPGIERIIRAYVADDEEFFKEQKNHHPKWATTKLDHLIQALSARHDDGAHKYGYDSETAEKLMKQCGFKKVIVNGHNESDFEPLRMDYRGKNLSLFFDAVK